MRVDGAVTGSIGPGLLVLLGVTHGDDDAACDRLADKVRALRIFEDSGGRMNEPLGDREVLVVSQFTLYGDTRKGNRPSFVATSADLPKSRRASSRPGPGRPPSRSTSASGPASTPPAACSAPTWRSSS